MESHKTGMRGRRFSRKMRVHKFGLKRESCACTRLDLSRKAAVSGIDVSGPYYGLRIVSRSLADHTKHGFAAKAEHLHLLVALDKSCFQCKPRTIYPSAFC